MKKIFNKLGLKILASLLLCSCTLGSKTIAMKTDGSGSGKPPSRPQRRALERQNQPIFPNGAMPRHSEPSITYAYRHLTCFLYAKKTPSLDIEFITGQKVTARSLDNISRALSAHFNKSIQKAQEYIESQGVSAPEFVPVLRTKFMVFYIHKSTNILYVDPVFTCECQTPNYSSALDDRSFILFLHQEDRKPLVEQMFPKKKSDGITREELPRVVKAKQDEAKAIEKNRAKMLADEKAAAEERKELMKQFPPDYNATSVDEFSMRRSDEKLQEARKKLEETDKAWLAKKMDQKRPKSYFPEAKERTDMVEIKTNSSQIPINDIRDLAPYCSTEHKAFVSLCTFLTENRDLERQICEVCEQIVNCFGKAQCPVTKLKGGLVIFETEDGTCDRTNAFEAYINDRYRVIFILHPEKGILFTDFGVHTI